MARRRAPVVILAVIVLGGVATVLLTRGMGFRARRTPSFLEETTMRAARDWATPSQVRDALNPAPASPEVIRAAMEHWADHCALCHGNDGRGQTSIGKSFYPPAPDMRASRTQDMSDGALFYVIEQGIPLTGMPAWGNGTPEGLRQSWELVRFIRHLPQITEEEIAHMEERNPKSPAQREQDKRIDDFLNGRDVR